MKSSLESAIEEYIKVHGESELESRLRSLLQKDEGDVLTIIVNKGQHPLSDCHKRGEIYIVSEGMLDLQNPNSVFKRLLDGLATKLKSKPWKKVYIVPFGPAALSMQVKLLVYRILHIDSIDVLHIGNNDYIDIDVKQRDFLSERNS